MAKTQKEEHIVALSKLVLNGWLSADSATADTTDTLHYLNNLGGAQLAELATLADQHHVTIRALEQLEKSSANSVSELVRDWCAQTLSAERRRINYAVDTLSSVCSALNAVGANVTVIKSLDHWPDLGSDLDLYTDGSAETVGAVMRKTFNATLEPRSWGDRLANKWNFRIPGLTELVEVHMRYLGQTGEHRLMAARVLERSLERTVNGHSFPVPAPEERVLISTLQRMYRHFFFRLCDIIDAALLVRSGAVSFSELRRGAELGGIWPGVCGFLVIVSRYLKEFGADLPLPDEVVATAYYSDLRVRFRNNYLRVPIKRAASLYGSQFLSAARRWDVRAISRLPLLPPLAASALVAYRITGSDKGVW
jgi:hypothetical protein